MVLFYLLSFIFLAPIGLFALARQRPIKNNFLFIIALIVFGFKAFLDFVLFVGFVFAEKSIGAAAYFLLATIVLIFFYKKVYTSTSSNQKSNETESNYDQFSENDYIEPYDSEDNLDFDDYLDDTDTSLESFGTSEELKSVIKEHEETGEVFTFYYKKTSDISAKLRNVVVLRLYSQNCVDYINCLDIDEDNTHKTFRVDRITEYKSDTVDDNIQSELPPENLTSNDKNTISLSLEEKEKLNIQYKILKQSIDFIDHTNKIIFKLKNEVNIFKSLSEEEDIKSILENQGFMLKIGRNIHVYDDDFNYVGTLNLNITKLKKVYPNLFFVSPFGIFSYDNDYQQIEITDKIELFTYSQAVVETIKNYDPKLYFEIKTKLKI